MSALSTIITSDPKQVTSPPRPGRPLCALPPGQAGVSAAAQTEKRSQAARAGRPCGKHLLPRGKRQVCV